MTTQTYIETLVIVPCANCRMTFGITRAFYNDRMEDGRRFYCPSGHDNYYGDCDVDRMKRRIATLEREEGYLRSNLKDAKRATTAARGQATKAKNRAKRGVCQYCNRTVSQMANHVKDKHPEKIATA